MLFPLPFPPPSLLSPCPLLLWCQPCWGCRWECYRATCVCFSLELVHGTGCAGTMAVAGRSPWCPLTAWKQVLRKGVCYHHCPLLSPALHAAELEVARAALETSPDQLRVAAAMDRKRRNGKRGEETKCSAKHRGEGNGVGGRLTCSMVWLCWYWGRKTGSWDAASPAVQVTAPAPPLPKSWICPWIS